GGNARCRIPIGRGGIGENNLLSATSEQEDQRALMCGIAGIISTDRSRDVGPAVERLTAELAHRGPDGTGLRFLGDRWAAFGHRRLSIVDLECGAQPMGNEDGQGWVVLNGELYNHPEIRKDLEHLGHRFTTRSDTEVLV